MVYIPYNQTEPETVKNILVMGKAHTTQSKQALNRKKNLGKDAQ